MNAKHFIDRTLLLLNINNRINLLKAFHVLAETLSIVIKNVKIETKINLKNLTKKLKIVSPVLQVFLK